MEYQPQELFEEIKLYGNEFHSVSFTGGEPLLQKDFLKEVLELTRKEGYKNYLETNGTLAGELSEVVEFLDIVAMDIKMASSSGMGNLLGMHQRFLKAAGDKEIFLKIVVCLSSQESELIEAIRMLKETNRTAILVLQPNSYEDAGLISEKTKKFKEICFKEAVTVCVIPQMHKLIGVL
jgi:organic radical activating enzyme